MDRIYTLQYLRAVAALAVVALHASERVHALLPSVLSSLLALGHSGVDLFFAISGFIMWSIACKAPTDPADFLLRRVIRVAPPYWIATLAWVAFVLIMGYDWIAVDVNHVLTSLAFIPQFSPTYPDRIWPVLVPGWTLTYEMFFYLLLSAILLMTVRLRLVFLTGLLVGLVALGLLAAPGPAWAIVSTSPLLLEFLGGCFAAELWMRRPGGVVRNGAMLATGVGLLAVFGHSVDPGVLWSRALGYGVPAILIVSGAVGLGRHVPRVSLLERLGDASYTIYLFHLFIVMLLDGVWQRLPALHGAGTAILFVLLTLVLASAVGLWIFRLVEFPLQRRLISLFVTGKRKPRSASG
jgi:exopolysaccharide production protein ExoZ